MQAYVPVNDYLLDYASALFEKEVSENSHIFKFGDLVQLEDSERVPLNSRDRAARQGPYPYYGATGIMDHVDDYLFDGIHILLGEDGTVITGDGLPILQYVWGKCWVNNHAHILSPKADYSLEMLYLALRKTNITHIVTGAVQMKISQKNLNKLELVLPSPDAIPLVDAIFEAYRNSVEESAHLSTLRDNLLPKLMSGEIDVSEVELP